MKIPKLLACLLITCSATSVFAAPRELLIFSDASVVEIEATSKKGIAEISFPSAIREGSLKAKPLDGGTISRVDLLPARISEKLQKDLDSLTEQKNRLEDRMKALETKEKIFAAAAKSQSSKAPRKSKTNPDPLTSVRQGTDFAIAQLEAVFTARRRTEQELKRIETKLLSLKKVAIGGQTVKVGVTPATTRLRVSGVLVDGGWKARYEIRLNGDGKAAVAMLADISNMPDGYSARIITAPIATGDLTKSFPAGAASTAKVAEWQLPVADERVSNGPLPQFTFSITNTSGNLMPSGEASVFIKKEFLGNASISALAANASATISNVQTTKQPTQ